MQKRAIWPSLLRSIIRPSQRLITSRSRRAVIHLSETPSAIAVNPRRHPIVGGTSWALGSTSIEGRDITHPTAVWAGSARNDVGANPLDDLGRRRAGSEHLGHTELLELGDIGLRDDPAAEDDDVLGVASLEQGRDLGKQGHVGAREH